MSWFSDVFTSRHTKFLEKEIERIRAEHKEELAGLKKVYEQQLSHAINENQKIFDELTKVRYVEQPALRNVHIGEDKTPPPKPSEQSEQGTPWQRVQRRYAQEQEMADKIRLTKPAEAPVGEGESNGSLREGRIEAPLGQ